MTTPAFQQYKTAASHPTYGGGICPSCKGVVLLDGNVDVTNNDITECTFCTTKTSRLRLIHEALATIDPVSWSQCSSDFYIYDQPTLKPGERVLYNVAVSDQAAKWLHSEAHPNAASNSRYQCNLSTAWPYIAATLVDTQAHKDPEPVPPAVWYWFGLSDLTAVPAWRQALFGAATLVVTYPPAAVVLVAAGFEAFFTMTMRTAWEEKGLGPAKYGKLMRRNPSISHLMEWLPAAVGAPDLLDAPDALHSRWTDKVNNRRNRVVHDANVFITAEEAKESMRTALDVITYIDPLAFVRPHVYYRAQEPS